MSAHGGGWVPHFIASDGARIAYRDAGDVAGRVPLVLLHGFLAHSGFFERQASLSSAFRLIAVDLRGHGDSRVPGHRLSVERIAADVAEIADALDLEGAVGIGWSLGATVLWHVLAGSTGRRFAGAVVVDMTACVRNGAGWELGLPQETCAARTDAIRDDFDSFARAAGQAIFAQPIASEHQALADWTSDEFARNDPAAMAAVWDSLVDQDARGLLAKIEQPTLIVHGGGSQLYGDNTAAHLVATLPQAEAMRFADCGHAPHLEASEAFNHAVTEFAARLSRARNPDSMHRSGEAT